MSHAATGAFVTFSESDGGFWLRWWPSEQRSTLYGISKSWPEAMVNVRSWLGAVRRDHSAPDLWAEIAKGQAIPGAADSPEYRKKFSAEELKLLESGLADIGRYISTTQPLDPAAKQQVSKRFAYLLDAAKQGARKIDWLNIFVGQVVNMISNGLLGPEFYGSIMTHATMALNAVFQLGVKLLS